MDRLQKTCMDLFKKDDLRKHIIQPIVQYLYNELYFYIWIICLYHILFIEAVLKLTALIDLLEPASRLLPEIRFGS